MSTEIAREALSVWDDIATFWDESYSKDGNQYFKLLQVPSLERLLGEKLAGATAGKIRALDLATGNGVVARLLARHGAEVLATDGSDNMLRIAADYVEGGMNMKFRRLDVTSDEEFERFVEEEASGFDIITINMSIMDIATLDPLARALPKLLTKDGIFVATVLHPVFITNNAARKVEIDFDPETGEARIVRSKVIKEYLSVPVFKGWAMPGQPKMQMYFHRPMCELFTTFFRGGLVMDAMEEPAFTEADARPGSALSNVNYTQLPTILSWRMRRASR